VGLPGRGLFVYLASGVRLLGLSLLGLAVLYPLHSLTGQQGQQGDDGAAGRLRDNHPVVTQEGRKGHPGREDAGAVSPGEGPNLEQELECLSHAVPHLALTAASRPLTSSVSSSSALVWASDSRCSSSTLSCSPDATAQC